MTTRSPTSQTGQRARKPAPLARGKRAAAPHIGPHGLGAQTSDFETFRMMAPVARAREIREGFEAHILNRIADELLEVPLQSLLNGLRLPASTIKRKLAEGDRLSPSESDRVTRVLLVLFAATDVIEDPISAARWVRTAHAELGGERPLDVLDTQAGYDRVQDLLLRLEYGVGV
jgi:putative toxin-antitoxin system antitoxin component (TIGR02293 family)